MHGPITEAGEQGCCPFGAVQNGVWQPGDEAKPAAQPYLFYPVSLHCDRKWCQWWCFHGLHQNGTAIGAWLFSRSAFAGQCSFVLKCLQRVTQADYSIVWGCLCGGRFKHNHHRILGRTGTVLIDQMASWRTAKSQFGLFQVVYFICGNMCSTVTTQHHTSFVSLAVQH